MNTTSDNLHESISGVWMQLFMGLMSGTSMDGIDAAIIDASTNRFISGLTCPYSKPTSVLLKQVIEGQRQTLKDYSQLNTLLGREFAKTALKLLEKANINNREIIAIGNHGQTLCHDPTADIPYTVQLACSHTIAALTGIKVVADFRTKDLVLGGQGAPLAPLYHKVLFQTQAPLALVNIGGIANLSFIDKEQAYGYDVGPGNALMDAWVDRHMHKKYDHNGVWASQGQKISSLLQDLLKDDFFQLPPPKSIGKEYFNLGWLQKFLQKDYSITDVQTTLAHLTALGIVNHLKKAPTNLKGIYICGGGAHNHYLVDLIRSYLPTYKIDTTQALGVDPDFIEAMLFAWLAKQTLENIPLDLRTITGCKTPTILGAIFSS